MDLGPQIPLNVLSQATRESRDTITQVASMINSSGMNRSQRRRLEKALKTTETITAHAQKRLDKSAYKAYQQAVDLNYVHFFAALALTMEERYHWKEDETHDQISSLLESVGKTIDKYATRGYDTEMIAKEVEDRIGLVLVPEEHK